jgi:hypothetical protein
LVRLALLLDTASSAPGFPRLALLLDAARSTPGLPCRLLLSSAPTLLIRIAVLATGRLALATAYLARLSLGRGRLARLLLQVAREECTYSCVFPRSFARSSSFRKFKGSPVLNTEKSKSPEMMMRSLLCVRVRATYAAIGNVLFGNSTIGIISRPWATWIVEAKPEVLKRDLIAANPLVLVVRHVPNARLFLHCKFYYIIKQRSDHTGPHYPRTTPHYAHGARRVHTTRPYRAEPPLSGPGVR